jgi:pimeloyl-ACP methyl ester carboxylesterase
MPPPDDGLDEVLLNYIEHNPSGNSTVLLIHGACTSSLNWDLVVPHLADTYHLLVPDLPGHGKSQNVTPFSAEYSSRLLERYVNSAEHISPARMSDEFYSSEMPFK